MRYLQHITSSGKLEFQLEVVKTLCAFVIEQRRALNCTLVVLASSVLCETATMDLGCSKKSLVDAFVEILPVAPGTFVYWLLRFCKF